MTTYNMESKAQGKSIAIVIASVAAVLCMFQPPIDAQSVNSGSDGSDGELNLAANLGVIVFDPMDAARWGRVLDADGDGVFNFTTINVAAGTTLKFSADKVNRAIYLLASGAVTINGTLDLNGANGFITSDVGMRRQVAVAGSGGFSGGAGALAFSCIAVPPTAGDGPLGGAAGTPCSVGAARNGSGGGFSGNRYLLPLLGGSGGGGGIDGSYTNGGAGGGAIIIASSTSIAIVGAIGASGGDGAQHSLCSGPGAGGGIRLVAPSITGAGILNVNGGTSLCGHGRTMGIVRLEAYSISGSLSYPMGPAFVTKGTPVDPATFRPAGQLRVLTIAGVAVPPNPAGSFVLPDVAISSSAAVPVNIEATGIPPGTVVTLEVFPQTPDNINTIKLPSAQATLTGTLQQSTATVNFVFPYGFSRGTIRATWSQ
jgi:hypothetical protein